MSCDKYRTFKNTKVSHIFEKYQFFLLSSVSAEMKMKKYLKKKKNQS